MKILENDKEKRLVSRDCNYYFRKDNGFMATWGRTKEEDPTHSPYGPFILDMEISTVCNKKCSFCYKSNTDVGENMNLETFKKIFHKMPKSLTQIALGIGSIEGNPDLWKIMEYCRNNDYNYVVPNITINGKDFTDEQADKLVNVAGAVAVSLYNTDECYGAVKKLTDRGLKQTNIHALLCAESLPKCYQVIKDYKTDDRLKDLNAIVFLLMKPKGDRNKFHQLTSMEEYKKLIDFAFEQGAPIGFDSCGCESFLQAVLDRDDYKKLEMLAEPCESTLFSYYIDAFGVGWPCSFCEGYDGLKGINLLEVNNFMDEVWNHPETVGFRNKLINSACESEVGCRTCPVYNLTMR